jgi:hypothetical protein
MHEASELLRVAVPIASVGALAATISIARVWVRRGDGPTPRALVGARILEDEPSVRATPVRTVARGGGE